MLRVLLADDHGVLRAGLRALLEREPDMTVVGQAGTAAEVVQQARELQPDVVLMDVRMPGSGLRGLKPVKRAAPGAAVLFLSQYDDPAYLREAMANGAAGYALKRAAGPELLAAIRAVGRGEVHLDPALARVVVEETWGPRRPPTTPAGGSLSARELEVLRLVALGHTTRRVAEQLALSIRTVETYKRRGMDKLGLRGRASLVRYALSHGLLEPDAAL